MNKFGTKEMRPLIDKLREAAGEEGRTPEEWAMLTDAADTLEAGDGYFMAVEGALA